MSRARLPRELAELKGAHRKDPQRYRQHIPKSSLVLGEPPEHLKDDARECWWEIASICIPGTVTGADALLLEVFANTLAEYRKEPDAFPVTKLGHLRAMMASFGLGPAERNKLGMDKPKDDDEYGFLDD